MKPRDVDGARLSSVPRVPAALWLFVVAVTTSGAVAAAWAASSLRHTPLNGWMIGLAVLTIVAGRFSIKLPGRPVTVSVSEVFVFTSLLLFGPGPATVTVAIDGLCIFFAQKRRRLHRGLFNVAEPALSTWLAGAVYFALAGAPELRSHAGAVSMTAVVAMTATYFLLNSTLQAVAVALETGSSPVEVWSQHAFYLSINYYAAASLASLAVQDGTGLNLNVIGLVAPLLILSFVAYKVAASRMEDSQRHIRDVEHLYRATVETLAIAVDAKDQVTHGHIRRVQRHTIALARALGVEDAIELKALEAASLLHDVGKLAVPDYVLNKPSSLSRREFDTMKQHATIGATILSTVEFPYPVVPIVRHHHEQWGGRGYPDGLAGEAIPLGARILTVVDCFDAVTSDRPYRRKLTDEAAIEILRERQGTMYDPRVVDTFVDLVPQLRRDDALIEHELEAAGPVAQAMARPTAATYEADAPRASGDLDCLSDIGEAVVDRLVRMLPAAEACLFGRDPEHDVLFVAHATPAIREVAGRLAFPIGEGLSGWVAANRHMIVNSRPDLDLGDAAVDLGLWTCTSAPVFAFGDLIAVLSVYAPTSGGFSREEVLTIGALAQQAGLEFAREKHGLTFEPLPARPSERRLQAVS